MNRRSSSKVTTDSDTKSTRPRLQFGKCGDGVSARHGCFPVRNVVAFDAQPPDVTRAEILEEFDAGAQRHAVR